MYSKFRYGDKVQETKKPRGGWDEEDSGYKIKNDNYNKSSNSNTSYKEDFSNNKNASSSYNSYKPPESEITVDKKSIIPIEAKLIEDLIQPTGISLRPNETQLKEFTRRAKNLDRELIFSVLIEKLSNYENMGDTMNMKTLIKILYLIEQLLQVGFNDLFQGFSEKQELFDSIKEYYSNNKKISEITSSINNLLSPNINSKSKLNNNTNLLGEEMSISNTKKVDLFEELSSPKKQNIPNHTSNTNILNIFSCDKDKTAVDTNSNQANNTNAISFSFIKKTNNENSQKNELNDIFSDLSVNPQKEQKKGFNFIKTKENISKTNGEFDSLYFNTVPMSNNQNSGTQSNGSDIPTIDLTKSSTADINEVFGKRNNIDIKHITSSYNQNFGLTSNSTSNTNMPINIPVDFSMGTKFDYNKVNEYIDPSKNNAQKDHFSFVNDLLKSKKN